MSSESQASSTRRLFRYIACFLVRVIVVEHPDILGKLAIDGAHLRGWRGDPLESLGKHQSTFRQWLGSPPAAQPQQFPDQTLGIGLKVVIATARHELGVPHRANRIDFGKVLTQEGQGGLGVLVFEERT